MDLEGGGREGGGERRGRRGREGGREGGGERRGEALVQHNIL